MHELTRSYIRAGSEGPPSQDYLLLEQIGKGGFATVYKAECGNPKKNVAIKLIPKLTLQKRGLFDRVTQEVHIHSKLNHPSILHLYEWFQDDNFVYLVLELCEKGNLHEHIRKLGQPLSEKDARIFLRQIVEGILYFQSRDIMHRDLKLHNFLLDAELNVKIADFGLATQITSPLDKHTTMCGTPNYISPEVAMRSPHGLETDVWSLGIVLYEMVVGHPPFDTTKVKTMGKHDVHEILGRVCDGLYKMPKFLTEVCSDLIEKCLCENVDERIKLKDVPRHPFFSLSHNKREIQSVDSGLCTQFSSGINTGYSKSSLKGGEYTNQLPPKGASPPVRMMSNPRDLPSYPLLHMNNVPLERKYGALAVGSKVLPIYSQDAMPPLIAPHAIINRDRSNSEKLSSCHSHRSGPVRAKHYPLSDPEEQIYNSNNPCRNIPAVRPESDIAYDHESSNRVRHFSDRQLPDTCSRNGNYSGSYEENRQAKKNDMRNQVCDERSYRLTSSTPDLHRENSSHLQSNSLNHAVRREPIHDTETNLRSPLSARRFNQICRNHSNCQTSTCEGRRGDHTFHSCCQSSHHQSGCSRLQNRLEVNHLSLDHIKLQDEAYIADTRSNSSRSSPIRPRTPSHIIEGNSVVKYQINQPADSKPSSLSSKRLKKIRQLKKNVISHILDDGVVCQEFLNKDQRVYNVSRISSDGLEIVLYQVNGLKGIEIANEPPEIPSKYHEYLYKNLPEKFWKKYICASRFVDHLKALTSKVTYYSDYAKCKLMENIPPANFEAIFYNGEKLVFSKSKVHIIKDDQTSLYDEDECPNCLSEEDRLLFHHADQIHQECLYIEKINTMAEEERRITYFPVTYGSRPPTKDNSSNLDKENVSRPFSKYSQSYSTTQMAKSGYSNYKRKPLSTINSNIPLK